MAAITLRGVCVEYDILESKDYNMKRALITGLNRKKFRGERTRLSALANLDLTITEGTRLGVIGLNGSGKSTLLRVLAGALPPTRGRVRIEGEVVSLLGGAGAGLNPEATGRENAILLGLHLGIGAKAMMARLPEIEHIADLGDRMGTAVGTYSSGMQARLRFAVLTTLRPEILIMDEGVATADAAFSERANRAMANFLGAAGILVMSSHGAGALSGCNQAIWLHRGALVAAGPVKQVTDAYEIFAAAKGAVS